MIRNMVIMILFVMITLLFVGCGDSQYNTFGNNDTPEKATSKVKEKDDGNFSAEKDLTGYWAVRNPNASEIDPNEYRFNFEILSDTEIIFSYYREITGTYTYDGVNFTVEGSKEYEAEDGSLRIITTTIAAKFTDKTKEFWTGIIEVKEVGKDDDYHSAFSIKNLIYKKYDY